MNERDLAYLGTILQVNRLYGGEWASMFQTSCTECGWCDNGHCRMTWLRAERALITHWKDRHRILWERRHGQLSLLGEL